MLFKCGVSGRVIWRGDGQFENEPGPRRNNTFYVDGPTVDFHQLLTMMLDAVYVDMTQGLVLGLKPKPEFLPLFNLGEPVTT